MAAAVRLAMVLLYSPVYDVEAPVELGFVRAVFHVNPRADLHRCGCRTGNLIGADKLCHSGSSLENLPRHSCC